MAMRHIKAGAARDMTEGSILRHLVLFALPLLLGNIFQMLYNTVDVFVVGKYVGTEALAAVGSTTIIVNMMVFFFNGFSIGAGVIIGNLYGAKNSGKLHTAVETTMASTFILSVLFSVIGFAGVKLMLRFMSTPAEVLPDATVYLRIYFVGLTGLLIYNMGSGILRAVGNTTLPLIFLIMTSILNVFLDLFFVLGLHMKIEGVAWATVISQVLSAVLVLVLLTRTKEIYRLVWKDLHINPDILKQIFAVGLPAGIQSVITAFSNIFVQSYINSFGAACMAGWGTYNKLDQFIMLPMQSMAMASTTFVSQNIGAGKAQRANRGTVLSLILSVAVTGGIAAGLFITAGPATGLFTNDAAVIEFSVLFLRTNIFFMVANSVNHVLAGALRGRGDSAGPMAIMLISFVALRQIYLFVVTRWVSNTPRLVGFGYPVGWVSCFILELTYFYLVMKGKIRRQA